MNFKNIKLLIKLKSFSKLKAGFAFNKNFAIFEEQHFTNLKRQKMKTAKSLLFLFIIFFLASCSQVTGEKGTLTDRKIQSYIKAYKGLKEAAPGMLKNLNENGETADAGKAGFADFEEIIKDAGMEDYPDFVRTNAKIGVIFSLIEANKGMNRSSNLERSGKEMIDDGVAFIETQLADPNVPEETKVELRKQIEEMKANKQKLTDTYAKNTKIANMVLDQVQKIQGMIVNEADIDAVQRHHADLFEAYTGFPEPAGMDGKLPKIDFGK